jgi:hypothetical protein
MISFFQNGDVGRYEETGIDFYGELFVSDGTLDLSSSLKANL